ncbi:MAG: OB-fold protein, partial [Chitinophagaceae bacterium]
EFETEEPASNKKYWDKVILVDGMVKEVSKDDRGLYSVILGDTASMSSVRCSMDSIHNHETAAVKKGDHLAVKGICAGFNADEMLGSDVILVRCAVYSKK